MVRSSEAAKTVSSDRGAEKASGGDDHEGVEINWDRAIEQYKCLAGISHGAASERGLTLNILLHRYYAEVNHRIMIADLTISKLACCFAGEEKATTAMKELEKQVKSYLITPLDKDIIDEAISRSNTKFVPAETMG